MKGIRPGPVQNGYDPAPLVHLEPQISQQIVNCHANHDRHIPACSPLHCLQQLTGEPGAVFRASSVFVRTSVAVRRHEHAHKLAGTGVEFKQIEPGFGRAPGGQFKFPDIDLYFLNGQSVGNGVLIGKAHGGGGYRANAFRHAGPSCSHLGHGFCPGCMDAVNYAFQMGNERIFRNGSGKAVGSVCGRTADKAGDSDEAGPVFCAHKQGLHRGIAEMTSAVG